MNHPPSQTSTGYGRRLRNYFDGDENKYEIWEVKFLASLRLSKLLDVVTRPAGTDGPEENDVDVARNADVFAEIVQCLDDRSLTLVMRDAKDDGRKAIEILVAMVLKGLPTQYNIQHVQNCCYTEGA